MVASFQKVADFVDPVPRLVGLFVRVMFLSTPGCWPTAVATSGDGTLIQIMAQFTDPTRFFAAYATTASIARGFQRIIASSAQSRGTTRLVLTVASAAIRIITFATPAIWP